MSFLSGLFGGGTQKSESTTTTQPWSPQIPYLTNGFQQAKDIYDQRTAAGPFTGSYYSPINDIQTGAVNQANAYTTGAGSSLPYTTAQTSGTLQGAAPTFVNNAAAMASNGVGAANPALTGVLTNYATGATTPQGVSSPLSQALEAAAVTGANSIASGQGTLQQAAQRALADPTASTVASAGTYANNPAINDAIKAAEQPVLQTLNEQTLPGLNRAATAGGNLNSSRSGVAEAMANRDAATQMANIEATMRGNAYNNGLNLAAQQNQAGTNAAISAGSASTNAGTNAALGTGNLQQGAGEFNTNTQLNAANSGLSSDLANRGLNANTQLGANAQLGSGVSTGVGAGTAAGAQAAQNYNTGLAAGGVLQNDQNAQLQNAYQQWQMQNGYDQGLLNNYWGIVGSGNWGGTTQGTQTTTGPSNVAGGLLGTALGIGSMFTGGGALSGLFSGAGPLSSGSLSAYGQYLNPYGATGNGFSPIIGSAGMLGGGV